MLIARMAIQPIGAGIANVRAASSRFRMTRTIRSFYRSRLIYSLAAAARAASFRRATLAWLRGLIPLR
jgi:hypothetical protein